MSDADDYYLTSSLFCVRILVKGGIIMATDKKRISTYVNDELYDKIKEMAEEQDRTVSSMLLVILKQYLNSK